jgi:hypothetical protein
VRLWEGRDGLYGEGGGGGGGVSGRLIGVGPQPKFNFRYSVEMY